MNYPDPDEPLFNDIPEINIPFRGDMEEDDLDPDQLDVSILHLKWSLITKIFEKLVVKFTLIYFI